MKAPSRTQLLSLLFIGSLLVMLFSPLYMYFSYDVAQLKSNYPHLKKVDQDIEFEIKGSRPKGWVKLREISSFGRWAIVLSEDWSFYQHQGIDVEQIKVALEQMLSLKKFRGASTITQQMVKNVFLSEDRTLWRKLHEIILAQKVESTLTKDKILENYLNVIEFGPDIYGIRAAAKHYFKKAPSSLTPREGAFLAMLLPSPKRYYVSFKKKKLTPFARSRIKNILIKMRMAKIISQQRYEQELAAQFPWE